MATDWYCDKCNAYLNDQDGFDEDESSWRCTECGALNSISSGGAFDLLDLFRRGIDEFTARPLDDPDDDD